MNPAANWRRAYHESIADEIDNMRQLRRDPLCRAYREVGARRVVKFVVDMTDAEIEEVARRIAETTMNRVIHQYKLAA